LVANDTEKALVDPEEAPAVDCTKWVETTVTVSVPVPVPAALVALNVTVDVPADVGVPEINPVPVFTDKPAGSPVAL
jgi:hypothetical protein